MSHPQPGGYFPPQPHQQQQAQAQHQNPPYPTSNSGSPFYPPSPQPQPIYSSSPNNNNAALALPPRSRSSSGSHRHSPMQQHSPDMRPSSSSLHPASAALGTQSPRAVPMPIPGMSGSPSLGEMALQPSSFPSQHPVMYSGSPGQYAPAHSMQMVQRRSGSHSSYDSRDRDMDFSDEDEEEEEHRRQRRRERHARRKLEKERDLEARPTLGGSLLSAVGIVGRTLSSERH